MLKTLLLIIVCVSTTVNAGEYSNVISGKGWEVHSSAFECRLSNSIPFYGDAVFAKRAGHADGEFYLDTQLRRILEGSARLLAEAPVWRPEVGRVNLGEISVQPSRRPIRLPAQEAERMLMQLNQGRELVFQRDTWYGGDREPRLVISSIGFRNAHARYMDCLSQLLPMSFGDIRRTAIYFPVGESEELPDDEVVKLHKILLYAQEDPYLKEIYIDGHTDNAGNREENLILSEQRAKLVSDYLTKRGLPEDRIILRWHGERYPATPNVSAASRAENRRVTLRLERVEPIELPKLGSL